MAQRHVMRRFLGLSRLGQSSLRMAVSANRLQRALAPIQPVMSSCSTKAFSTSPQARVSFNVQDEDDFQDRVVNSKTPVVVDFHAKWCGPCKILGPRLEKIIAAQEGKVVLAKVDIDDNQDLAIEHGVSAVPTVISFKDGSPADKFIGLKDDDQLDSFVAKLL